MWGKKEIVFQRELNRVDLPSYLSSPHIRLIKTINAVPNCPITGAWKAGGINQASDKRFVRIIRACTSCKAALADYPWNHHNARYMCPNYSNCSLHFQTNASSFSLHSFWLKAKMINTYRLFGNGSARRRGYGRNRYWEGLRSWVVIKPVYH